MKEFSFLSGKESETCSKLRQNMPSNCVLRTPVINGTFQAMFCEYLLFR